VYNDRLAIEVLQYLSQRGIRVPQDVAVIGFDDIRSAKMTAPPLSTIRYSLDEIADHAVCALRERRAEPDAPPIRLVVPVDLVIRQSTAGHVLQDFSRSFAAEPVIAAI
jgi:LacI family transcriptional regulator